jgi:hypothetical protein
MMAWRGAWSREIDRRDRQKHKDVEYKEYIYLSRHAPKEPLNGSLH